MVIKYYDVIVVGGGVAGLCTALAAARHGAKTALVHNRPVFGGNASSEIRMHICGADNHNHRSNARETGIVEDILLENKRRNPHHNFSIFDMIMWEKAMEQKGLDSYLNTHMTDVFTENNKIKSIIAHQLTSERIYQFNAQIFVDATGDGTLSFKAGAEAMYGREDSAEFGEANAPKQADEVVMGNSLMFQASDKGVDIKFVKPKFAYSFNEDDFYNRPHNDFSSGYWWIELGGDKTNTIDDAEEISKELLKTVFGVWDHVKNSGNHPGSKNYDLDWVGFLPGKRDSRRIKGDHVLTGNDCLNSRTFDDAIGYGGWPMDMHTPGGFRAKGQKATDFIHLADIFSVPYRSIYSRNVENLMLAGRIISASHMAFGSIRVMATLGSLGQSCGIAAAMAIHENILPRDVLNNVKKLQQEILKADGYIMNIKNEDSEDLARTAKVTASSQKYGGEVENIINGITRMVGDSTNQWISSHISNEPEWIELKFDNVIKIKQVRITFDSNLSKAIMPSMSKDVINAQVKGIPLELIKDYDLSLFLNGNEVKRMKYRDNYQRLNVCDIDSIVCDSIRIEILSTHGDEYARVFEVRAYA